MKGCDIYLDPLFFQQVNIPGTDVILTVTIQVYYQQSRRRRLHDVDVTRRRLGESSGTDIHFKSTLTDDRETDRTFKLN